MTAIGSPSIPPDLRIGFLAWAVDQVGKPYVWGADGPDAFDCSGFCNGGYYALRLCDWRETHNCQTFWETLPPTNIPKPADLALYGRREGKRVIATHVMVHFGDGRVLGACGGNRDTITVEIARQKGAQVKFKPDKDYRPGFLGYRVAPLDPKESAA